MADKTKEGLIEKIKLLQKRITELEAVDTERKKAEQTAKESREYAESIVDTVRESLIVLDASLKVISANRSFYQTFKVNPEEIQGQFIYDLGNRQWDIPKLRKFLEEILPHNNFFENYKIEHSFAAVGPKTMLLNARRLASMQMILLAIEDISERSRIEKELRVSKEKERALAAAKTEVEHTKAGELRKAYDELKETQERLIRSEKLAALGKLATTISHELRNPLGVIRNSVYFLKLKLGKTFKDEKIKKHLRMLEEEVDISNGIISSILTFVQQKIPNFTETNVNEVIEKSLKKSNVPKNIDVVIQLKSDLPRIQADEIQLYQVFSNIILNAIQAMSQGGKLTITSLKKDKFLEVSIADTGEGIPKENLNKIFEPLFSTKARGIGLGLTVCQSIIEDHKGGIEVESEFGKGTKVIVKLPIGKEGV